MEIYKHNIEGREFKIIEILNKSLHHETIFGASLKCVCGGGGGGQISNVHLWTV